MGDSYATAFSCGLKDLEPTVVNLADNRLSKKGSRTIIKSLKPSICSLDLSQNVIDEVGAYSLGEFAKLKANSLRQLDLENTRLGDTGVISLCKQLLDHPKLSILNLSKNRITDSGCGAISQLVSETFYFTTLLLHWNYISGDGAAKVLGAAARYGSMKVFDLSWNSVGRAKTKVFVKQLADTLTTQENIMHMDLSHNQIRREHCKEISESLKSNHTLWGLHFADNEGYTVDAKGYLVEDTLDVPVGAQHIEHRIGTLEMLRKRLRASRRGRKQGGNCWICEGWSEAAVEHPLMKLNEPVYLNLECDDYKPDLMYTEPGVSGYVLWRMWPPGRTKFFFTVEGKAVISLKYPVMRCRLKRRVKTDDELYPFVDVNLTEVNYMVNDINTGIVNDVNEVTAINCVPRPVAGFHFRPKTKKARVPWSIPISLFKDYIVDTDVRTGANVDAVCEVLPGGLEEDGEAQDEGRGSDEVQGNLQKKLPHSVLPCVTGYRKETYKYYSAIGRTELMFTVNKLTLSDFIAHKICLYDGDHLTEMDITFSTVKGRPKVAKFQPRTALVRFEFMELLFRLALKRYYEGTFPPQQ